MKHFPTRLHWQLSSCEVKRRTGVKSRGTSLLNILRAWRSVCTCLCVFRLCTKSNPSCCGCISTTDAVEALLQPLLHTAHSSLCVCARVCAPCATVHQRGWCACWIWMIIEELTLRDALLLWLFFSLRNSLLWQGCTPLPLCLSHVHPCPMSYSPQMLLCIDRELVKWEHAVHTKAPAVRPVYTLSHTHTVA